MAPFQLSRHHPIFQSEQLLNYLENSWNVFQFDSCRAKKHAAMQEANPLKIYFFNGLEIKRASKCPLETQLGDRAALEGAFSLQVLRIGTERAGRRHLDWVYVKPKQVFESERCSQASGLFCLHDTKTPSWPMPSTHSEVRERETERTTER